MRETGIVKRIVKQGVAEVEFASASACAKCGKCGFGASGELIVEAENKINALAGDEVEVEIYAKSVIASSFLVYIVPVIFLVAGYFIGVWAASFLSAKVSTEGWGIISSLLFALLSFVVLMIFDARASKRNKPCAEILGKAGG